MEPHPSPQEGQPLQIYAPPVDPGGWRPRYASFSDNIGSYGRSQFQSVGYQEPPGRLSRSQTCYNCGSPDHWAQNCSQPRRFHSVGTGGEFQPPKRRNTSGSTPPARAFPPPYRPQWGGLSPGTQSNYALDTDCPPAIVSSFSHDTYPWPPPFIQGSPGQPFSHHGSYGLQTPTSTHNPQFPSPVSTHDGHQYHSYFPPLQQSSWDNNQLYDCQQSQQPLENGETRPPLHPQHAEMKNTFHMPSIKPWMDKVQFFQTQQTMKPSDSQIFRRPANPSTRPLPSTFPAEEGAYPSPPVGALEPGMTVSRYVSDRNTEESRRHIRETQYWPSIKDDPVFREILTDCKSVPIKELVSRRNQAIQLCGRNILERDEADKSDQNRLLFIQSPRYEDTSGESVRPREDKVDDTIQSPRMHGKTFRRPPQDRLSLERCRPHIGQRGALHNDYRQVKQQIDNLSLPVSDRRTEALSREHAVDTHSRQMQSSRSLHEHNDRSPIVDHNPAQRYSKERPSHLSGRPRHGENSGDIRSQGTVHSEKKYLKRPRSVDSEDRYDSSRRQKNDAPSKSRRQPTENSSVYSRRW